MAESGFTPARALLNHRRAGFAQRLHARPRSGQGPEEILGRENSILTARLRAAAAIGQNGTAETQEWSTARRFPGRIIVDERAAALHTASEWNCQDTVWTGGSRQEDGRVGAPCVWRTQEGWTRRRFHLGTNKEVFDGETLAIYQAPRDPDQRQESGHRYTAPVDSTSAINRVRDDALGHGQRFAVAATEVCSCILARDNDITIRWVLEHSGAAGNEVADEYAKSVATGDAPVETEGIPEGYINETSLSHLTRVATEARSHGAAEWISGHFRPERRYRPPRDEASAGPSSNGRERPSHAATTSAYLVTWRQGPTV